MREALRETKGHRSALGGANGRRSKYQDEGYHPKPAKDSCGQSGYRSVASRAIRRRPGHTVFVENVSKRIHVSTLREVFQSYGQVVDVYIAYWNRKRVRNSTTFAFVRFMSPEEARGAVRMGDNRKMDGYNINVSLEKVTGLVMKERGKRRCKSSTNSIRKSKWKEAKKQCERQKLLAENKLKLRKIGSAVDNKDRGSKIEDEVDITLRMGQKLDIVFDTPDAVVRERLSTQDVEEGK
ncbi:hypothetical protein V6N12_007307 [Hibiscus sabdariffa]|uniref:RRM domain-containing protein n=1 Tax=Hibiscus sabdariffa TaxID=183260 RepID=A0ABR2F1F8_9ROSI